MQAFFWGKDKADIVKWEMPSDPHILTCPSNSKHECRLQFKKKNNTSKPSMTIITHATQWRDIKAPFSLRFGSDFITVMKNMNVSESENLLDEYIHLLSSSAPFSRVI